MHEQKSPALDLVLQRLALYRMFLPLVAVSAIAIGAVGFLGKQTLESQQHQTALSMVVFRDRYFIDITISTLYKAEISSPDGARIKIRQ